MQTQTQKLFQEQMMMPNTISIFVSTMHFSHPFVAPVGCLAGGTAEQPPNDGPRANSDDESIPYQRSYAFGKHRPTKRTKKSHKCSEVLVRIPQSNKLLRVLLDSETSASTIHKDSALVHKKKIKVLSRFDWGSFDVRSTFV